MNSAGKVTITKRFGPYPMGHRQYKHKGHCSYAHGHDVSIDVTFSAIKLDKTGFIKDFGKMKELKEALTNLLDHTFLICTDDPKAAVFVANDGVLFDLRMVPDVSAEGMAEYLYDFIMARRTVDDINRGVRVESVTFWEDPKNSATFIPA